MINLWYNCYFTDIWNDENVSIKYDEKVVKLKIFHRYQNSNIIKYQRKNFLNKITIKINYSKINYKINYNKSLNKIKYNKKPFK